MGARQPLAKNDSSGLVGFPTGRLILVISRVQASIRNRARRFWHQKLLDSLGQVGTGVRFAGPPHFTGQSNARIADNVHIGTGAFIRAEGGLSIGSNTHISRNLLLYTINHDYEGTLLPYDHSSILKPVTIGKNVWIGMNVCIAPGTSIGDGAVIGMGTVVAGEVPPLAIIASQQWRVVGMRDADHYADLDVRGQYGGSGGRPLS